MHRFTQTKGEGTMINKKNNYNNLYSIKQPFVLLHRTGKAFPAHFMDRILPQCPTFTQNSKTNCIKIIHLQRTRGACTFSIDYVDILQPKLSNNLRNSGRFVACLQHGETQKNEESETNTKQTLNKIENRSSHITLYFTLVLKNVPAHSGQVGVFCTSVLASFVTFTLFYSLIQRDHYISCLHSYASLTPQYRFSSFPSSPVAVGRE